LHITFASEKLRNYLHDDRQLKKDYGEVGYKRIRQRLDELYAAETLAAIGMLRRGRCHELKGDRAGQLALDLHKGYRLIIEPADEPRPEKPDGGLDWANVTAVRVLEVEDYHRG
jgi:plasmid maintenance system killer protein